MNNGPVCNYAASVCVTQKHHLSMSNDSQTRGILAVGQHTSSDNIRKKTYSMSYD